MASFNFGTAYYLSPLSNPSRYLNRYGNGYPANNQNVSLYAPTGVADQRWTFSNVNTSLRTLRIYSELTTSASDSTKRFGLNVWLGAANKYNCDICKVAGNEKDSLIKYYEIVPTGMSGTGVVAVKFQLVNYPNYYLTAVGDDVRWETEHGTQATDQLWWVRSSQSGSAPSGSGIGLSFKRPSGVWIRGFTTTHLGIDYDGAIGNEIKAAGYGKVIYTNNSISTDSSKIESLGKTVYIEHYNATGTVCGMTIYGHLDTINVSKNQTVQEGQKIGTMGNTGYVIPGPGGDGSHLHFALKKGSVFTSDTLYNVYHSGNWADPEPYLR